MDISVTNQLVEELNARLMKPALLLLSGESVGVLAKDIQQYANRFNDPLPHEAQQLVQVLFPVPAGRPELVGQAAWWRSDLGIICATAMKDIDAESVTHHQAAAMLRIKYNAVGKEIVDGRLKRHPEGGIARASVLERVVIRHHKKLRKAS